MGTLRSLIKESKNPKKEMIAVTVRIPKELYSFVDELTDHLSSSRQEVLLRLIEEGILVAQDELNKTESASENSRFHLLNTSKRYGSHYQEMMLRQGIAAAFHGDYKYNIDRIKNGDFVFLYENGLGIIAYGIGTGDTLTQDCDGCKDECRYQKLSDFKILSAPLPTNEIRNILNGRIVFLRTMTGISDGQKLLNKLREHDSMDKNS